MRQWKRYPKYKDSGVEWLGEIPEGWGVKRIKLASPIINEKIDLVNQNFQYIALENIESWTGRFKESNSEIQPESLVNIFCKNNVLFGKLRPYLAKVYHTSNNGVCSSEFFVLKPKDITPNYLFEYLLNREFIDIINSSTYGAKMPRANWDFWGSTDFNSTPPRTNRHRLLPRPQNRPDRHPHREKAAADRTAPGETCRPYQPGGDEGTGPDRADEGLGGAVAWGSTGALGDKSSKIDFINYPRAIPT